MLFRSMNSQNSPCFFLHDGVGQLNGRSSSTAVPADMEPFLGVHVIQLLADSDRVPCGTSRCVVPEGYAFTGPYWLQRPSCRPHPRRKYSLFMFRFIEYLTRAHRRSSNLHGSRSRQKPVALNLCFEIQRQPLHVSINWDDALGPSELAQVPKLYYVIRDG